MIKCTFRLNGAGISTLSCPGVGFFPAYSGNPEQRNDPEQTTVKDIGPLPPGRYYIVARPVGGLMFKQRDWVKSIVSGSDHESWFALFRDDNLIDDTTFIEDVERGNFRLHPAGYRGISNGCITFTSKAHFAILRDALLITTTAMVSPTMKAFGTVQVY